MNDKTPPISVPTESRPQLFVKNPVQIEACQFTDEASAARILSWIGENHNISYLGPIGYYNGVNLYVRTLESAGGYHEATLGDWIIRGIKGEFYPCKPDIFAETYRPAASSSLLPVPEPEKVCKECGTEVEAARCSHVINDYGFMPDLCHLAYKHEGDHKWCRRCCLRFAGRCVECGSFPSMHLKDCPLASLPVGESRSKLNP